MGLFLFPEHLIHFFSQYHGVHGFFQVICRSHPDGLYGGLDIGIPCHNEHRTVGRGFPDPFEQSQAVSVGQPQVTKDNVIDLRLYGLHGLAGGKNPFCAEPGLSKPRLQQGVESRVVFYDQYFHHEYKCRKYFFVSLAL